VGNRPYSEFMKDAPDPAFGTRKAAAGLCDSCTHGRQIASDRKSVFLLCQLSVTDSRFPKYPRLPVLRCAGYKKKP